MLFAIFSLIYDWNFQLIFVKLIIKTKYHQSSFESILKSQKDGMRNIKVFWLRKFYSRKNSK